jgi:alpha-tubulin suppressor-like RCC1 family protein
MPSARPVFKLVSIALAAWFVGCTDPTGSRSTAELTGVASARSTSTVTVTSTMPSAAPRDTTLDVQVNGSGFGKGAIASFQLNGIVDSRVRVNSTQFVKSTQVVANLTIAATADTGQYDVAVSNLSGTKGIGTELFAVKVKGSVIALSPTSVNFSSIQGGNPDPKTVNVSNSGLGKLSGLGVGTITYAAGQPTGWLTVSLSATSGPTTLTLTATSGSLPSGTTYTATVPVTSSVAINSPQTLSVTFSANMPPFAADAMGVGGDQTCGLSHANGGWYCWGDNQQGGLGDGTTTNRLTPVAVTGGLTFATVSSGGINFTCGLTATNAAYCWGNNWYGQLGDGTMTDSHTPVAVTTGGLTFVTVTAGLNHTCGLTADGLAYCWGRNTFGQLGVGDTTRRLTPVAVAGGLRFASLRAMSLHTCGLTGLGAAYCWGLNDSGQLGDGTQTYRYTPVAVKGGLTFVSLSDGDYPTHTCGLTSGGAAYCWGYNNTGQLGDGTTTERLTPVAVVGGLLFAELSGSCGRTDAGAAYCWGGETVNSLTPGLVPGGLKFTALSLGGGHPCGLAAGIMYCWGWNGYGALGDGTTTSRSSPTPVSAP